MKTSFMVLAATLVLAQNAFAQDTTQPQALGGGGESCRARVDCKAGFKCINQVCTDEHEGQTCGATSDCGNELRCIQNKCTTTAQAQKASASSSSTASTDEWMKFNPTDGNTHPFVGISGGGGFGTAGISGNTPFTGGFNTFDGNGLFALNGGLYMGNHELSLEIAPVTYIWDAKYQPGPIFEMTASYAYLVPLTESGNMRIFWPIRFGLGMFAGPGNNLGGLAFFEVRADLIGAAIQIGHVMIDLHLPSFRYAITDKSGVQAHMLHWIFGVTIGYAF